MPKPDIGPLARRLGVAEAILADLLHEHRAAVTAVIQRKQIKAGIYPEIRGVPDGWKPGQRKDHK